MHVGQRLGSPAQRVALFVGRRQAGRTPGGGVVGIGDIFFRWHRERIRVTPVQIIRAVQIISHAPASLLSKCHNRWAETILFQSYEPVDPDPRQQIGDPINLVGLGFHDLGIDAQGGDGTGHPDLSSPQGVATGIGGGTQRNDATGVGHETGQVSDRSLDHDVSTLHRHTAARSGIPSNVDEASPHRCPCAHAAIAVDGDMPSGHRFARPPPGVA